MKWLAVLAVLALVLAVERHVDAASACPSGEAQGFIAIRSDPNYLVGTIPSTFTGNALYFTRRFNCHGRSAQVRRLDLGTYEVRFPGLDPRVVIVSAISAEGISASVYPLGRGIVRVALRGPLVVNDVLGRRDVPFSVAVY